MSGGRRVVVTGMGAITAAGAGVETFWRACVEGRSALRPLTGPDFASFRRWAHDLGLPAGHFGLGHGSGAHAPDEYFVIESSHPKVAGWDAAVGSYVDYLYELAESR